MKNSFQISVQLNFTVFFLVYFYFNFADYLFEIGTHTHTYKKEELKLLDAALEHLK